MAASPSTTNGTAFVTVTAPMSWPSAFTVSVLVSLQPEFVQEIVFTPAFVQVGSVVAEM